MPGMETIPLWPAGQVPYARGTGPDDTPSLTLYPPSRRARTAFVVCPGGGYGGHAAHEGEPIARWLNRIGIAAGVLAYRLGPRYRHPAMLTDAQQAIRTMRRQGFGRVGILGFSAGGHLASTAATHFTGDDDRPDAAVLIYPVITLEGPLAHAGSRTNLLGENPDPALVASLSNQNRVTARTPPTFLVHGSDDQPVPVENSLLFATALARQGVPFGLQVYARGPHGFGLGDKAHPETQTWPERCADWLKAIGFSTY